MMTFIYLLTLVKWVNVIEEMTVGLMGDVMVAPTHIY